MNAQGQLGFVSANLFGACAKYLTTAWDVMKLNVLENTEEAANITLKIKTVHWILFLVFWFWEKSFMQDKLYDCNRFFF